MKKNQTKQSPAAAGQRGMKRKVFVVEDHPLMRRSIVEAIEREPDLTVCGQAESATEVPAIVLLQPDLVLTDIQLKSSSGLDLIGALRVRSPILPIVATTMFDVRRTERLARAAGASDFVSKEEGPDRMIAVIRQVLDKNSEHYENH
jgi:DNA-binding NarL/FixJ family response regulator